MVGKCFLGRFWDNTYLADFPNLSLVPACYDHDSVSLLHVHGYPHRIAILVELVRLPLLPWALQQRQAQSAHEIVAVSVHQEHKQSGARGARLEGLGLTKAPAVVAILQLCCTCSAQTYILIAHRADPTQPW